MSQTVELIVEGQNPRPADARTVGVVIPTYNASKHWPELEASLAFQGIPPQKVLIVDSTSVDSTRDLARRSGYRVVCIPKEEFGHGATRQLACGYLPEAEYLVFMTQDAVLDQPDSIERLCDSLSDLTVGLAFGRQIPRREAGPIERHARLFNYPMVSQVRTLGDRSELGIKATFCSNSFAVYRRSALEQVGGFPQDVLFGEDAYVAAKMLLAGWKVAYRADAAVVHSHTFTVWQEFQRYFDIGVHHHRESWLLEEFGHAGSEGARFVLSELRYLRTSRAVRLIPLAFLRSVTKLIAYRLGSIEHKLPLSLNRLLSMSPSFWPEHTAVVPLRRNSQSTK
jgi:rhamnosyltransferase